MSIMRTQSVSYSQASSRAISLTSNLVDRSPPGVPVNREVQLSQQLDDRLTTALSNIRQQMSASGSPASSPQGSVGNRLDIRA